MSSSSLHRGSDEKADVADANGAVRENRPSRIRITVIVQNRYTLDAGLMTGRQIKETADVPAGLVLYRRAKGGNEPVPDDALIEPRNGDHFFARAPSNVAIDEEEL
jgi:hypothetical protein